MNNRYPAHVYPYVVRYTRPDGMQWEAYAWCKNETIAMKQLEGALRWVNKGVYTAAWLEENK